MTKESPNALSAAVLRLLRPLVRVLLRNGVSFGDFAEQAKKVFVDVAADDFSVAGRKPSISRTAVLTGLTRKEVSRLAQLEASHLDSGSARYNRAARVISGWVRDPDFTDASGAPALLAPDGDGRSFAELVRRHGADVPARAVLDELVRVGAIAEQPGGQLRLLTNAYVPAADAEEKLAILGTDVAELIATIDHNITSPRDARFQRKVSYDNLPPDVLPGFRRGTSERAQRLLEELDRELSAHDRDVTRSDDGSPPPETGRYVCSVGIYYYEAPFPQPAVPEE